MWAHWAVSMVYHAGLACCISVILAALATIVVIIVRNRKRHD